MLFFSDNLDCNEHVSYVLSICSQRLYLIKLLHSQGMPERKLHEIFVALIVSRISYALSAWGGFLTGQQINRIMFIVKYDVLVFVPLHDVCDVSEYLRLADSKLFKSIQNLSLIHI